MGPIIVSHDLRTPLTSIKGYLQLLKEHGYQSVEEREAYFETVCRQTDTLAQLVEELFAYTRVSDPQVKLELHTVCFNQLVRQVAMDYSLSFEQSGLALELELPQEKFLVQIAPDEFARVLQNLCQNILRYAARPGKAVFSLARDGEDGLLLTVANTSPPLQAEEYAHLFDKFYRREKSRSHQTGGTGLGLAIAKTIVERHRGKIWGEGQDEMLAIKIWLPFAD